MDTSTGGTRLFDRTSGVSLVDAVAASCAVPGVWPPVTIGDARYIDGGVRTFTNLDLAADYARVLVIAPMPDPALEDDAASIVEHGRIEVTPPTTTPAPPSALIRWFPRLEPFQLSEQE
ncbi:patatin-like phospholipase family protein [Streptomyces sp. NPDC002577]